MKVELVEYDHCFGIVLKPETVQEAATAIRFGINGTKEVRSLATSAYKDGTITADIVIGKVKQSRSALKRGGW